MVYHYMTQYYQYIGIIHLTVAKKCYNILLNVETRQPYHTKVLKWSLTSWSVLGENRVSSYHRVILLGNFQAVTDHHAHIQGSFALQFILQVWIKYLKKTKFIATCYPPLYIFRVWNWFLCLVETKDNLLKEGNINVIQFLNANCWVVLLCPYYKD